MPPVEAWVSLLTGVSPSGLFPLIQPLHSNWVISPWAQAFSNSYLNYYLIPLTALKSLWRQGLYQLDLLVSIPNTKSDVWPCPLCDSGFSWSVIRLSYLPTKLSWTSHCVQVLHLLQVPAQMLAFSLKFYRSLQSAVHVLSLNGQHLIFTSNPTNHLLLCWVSWYPLSS